MARFGWIIAGVALVALGLPGAAWSQEDGEKDCRYVSGNSNLLKVRNAYDAWFAAEGHDPKKAPPALERMGGANVHLIVAPNCQAQCIGRIFCYSQHPEFKGKTASDEDMVRLGQVVNCDPNPNSELSNPSCKPAEECMADAIKEPWRVSKPGKISSVGPSFFSRDPKDPDEAKLTVKYGADRSNPETEVPVFTVPADPKGEHPGKRCQLCSSVVTLAERAFSYTVCNVPSGPAGWCPNANACFGEHKGDEASYAVASAQGRQIRHYGPVADEGFGNSGAPAGSAADAKGKK